MSQLLRRLENEIINAADAAVQGRALAQKAIYLARVGRFSESRAIIQSLRAMFGDERSGPVTLWIMLAEGLVKHFEALDSSALDRIKRCQLLALAISDQALIAISSAWRAQIEFEISDFKAMKESLALATLNTSDENLPARTRTAMILSQAFFLTGNGPRGQAWFIKGRESAIKEGDQASLEALLYNRAAFRLARLRVMRCFGELEESELRLLRSEVRSVKNFQRLLGLAALTGLVDICAARLHMLEGKYDMAIAELESLKQLSPRAKYNFSEAFLDLEIRFCRSKCGEVERGAHFAEDFTDMDVDERLVAHWMLMQMAGDHLKDGAGAIELVRLREEYEGAMKLIQNAVEGIE